VNGILLSGLILSWQPAYLIGGGLIGATQSTLYTFFLRRLILQKHAEISKEERYVDKDFCL
jgi:hypothetical protein